MHDDRRPARFFLRALGTAAAYAGCAWLSQEVVYGHTDACALWPAAGVGLAAVLLFGRAAGALGTFIGSLVGVSLFFGSRLGPEADQTHVSLVDERGRLERVPRPRAERRRVVATPRTQQAGDRRQPSGHRLQRH